MSEPQSSLPSRSASSHRLNEQRSLGPALIIPSAQYEQEKEDVLRAMLFVAEDEIRAKEVQVELMQQMLVTTEQVARRAACAPALLEPPCAVPPPLRRRLA